MSILSFKKKKKSYKLSRLCRELLHVHNYYFFPLHWPNLSLIASSVLEIVASNGLKVHCKEMNTSLHMAATLLN